MSESSKLRTLRLVWYYLCNIEINRHHAKFLLVERKEREWNWGRVQWEFNWTGEEKSEWSKQNKFPLTPSAQASVRTNSTPVLGQDVRSSHLSHLHIPHHQYSSQHPIGHYVTPRNILGSPLFSCLRTKRLQLASLTSGSHKNSFYYCLGPWQWNVSCLPFPF